MSAADGKKVALLTGCSSGFGYLTALTLARNDWHVCATMRDLMRGDTLIETAKREQLSMSIRKLDVTDSQNVKEVVEKLENETGSIDLLVNNAGCGLIGALEDTDLEQIRDQFETNFFGCVRMIQAVMPIFRRQRQGFIINITSIAGLVGMPLYGPYCASKYALEGLTESMRFECRLYNVRILNVEPGHYSTNFASTSLKYGARTFSPTSPYAKLNEHFANRTKGNKFSDPQEVVDLIVDIASGRRSSFWNPIGSKVWPVFLCKRILGIEITQKIMRFLMKVPG